MKIRILITIMLVIVLSVSVNVTASTASQDDPVDLGTLGGTYSVAVDVNDLNQVIGLSTLAGDQIYHGFLWNDGIMTDLGTLGGDGTEPSSINNNGQIVGSSEIIPGGPYHAFLWENGVMMDLGAFGGLASWAVDINDQGQILGYTLISTSPDYIFHYFVFDGENLTLINGFDGAFAINESGQVVGRMNNHAAIWDNGTVIDLGTLGGPASIAFDISNSGFVVGQSYGDGVDFFDHGFIWENGIISDLGTLGGETSEARGVNNSGKVVGWSVTEGGSNQAFIWYEGVMSELATLGGNGTAAYAINENGVIAGFSTLPGDSESHATLWNLSPSQDQLTDLSPARVWIGLKNSDDVGIKFDLLAEVYLNDALIGVGELKKVDGGGSGFNNARLNMIPLTLFASVNAPQDSTLSTKLYVRNTCYGNTRNSGTARLWYNDASANSQFGATIDHVAQIYFLQNEFVLGTTPGSGPKKTIDVEVGQPCGPYKLFGIWSMSIVP